MKTEDPVLGLQLALAMEQEANRRLRERNSSLLSTNYDLRKERDLLTDSLAAAERERDALRELLREARGGLATHFGFPRPADRHSIPPESLLGRIDAALERQR